MKRAVDKKAFGHRLMLRRTAAGLTQTQLAKAVGMKQQGVDNIENGIVARPRLLREIAQVLSTTEKWLLWADGPEIIETSPAPEFEEFSEVFQALSPSQRKIGLRLLKSLKTDDTEAA